MTTPDTIPCPPPDDRDTIVEPMRIVDFFEELHAALTPFIVEERVAPSEGHP